MDQPDSHDAITGSDSSTPPQRREELVAIGERIKAARMAAGLTQQQLADLIEVNRVEVSMMENGTREVGALRLRRLAGALNVSSDSLLTADGPPAL